MFQHQNSIGEYGHLTAIRHALDNWKPIWEQYCNKLSYAPPHNMVIGGALTTDNAWRRIGFYRHAHEYWLLASVIIDRIARKGAASSEDDQRSRVKASPEGSTPDPILTRYDQTSMRQVNDLIADFQKFQIRSDGGYEL